MEHGVGSDLALRDCDSDLRRSLADSYSKACSRAAAGAAPVVASVTRCLSPWRPHQRLHPLPLRAWGSLKPTPFRTAMHGACTDATAGAPEPRPCSPRPPSVSQRFPGTTDPSAAPARARETLPLEVGCERRPAVEPTEQVCSARAAISGWCSPSPLQPCTTTDSPVPYPVTTLLARQVRVRQRSRQGERRNPERHVGLLSERR